MREESEVQERVQERKLSISLDKKEISQELGLVEPQNIVSSDHPELEAQADEVVAKLMGINTD